MQPTKVLTILLVVLANTVSNSQNMRPTRHQLLERFGFTEHSVVSNQDTVLFFVHQKPNSKPKNLVLYLQGTSPDPLFSIESENGTYNSYRWFPNDYKLVDDTYCYAVISKNGIPAISDTGTNDFSAYHKTNSLQYRVQQADKAIQYIIKRLINDVDKVIVYGHSEGAPVAAKLATINKSITHLGFWAGNALPDYFDFLLNNSRQNWAGQISDSVAFKNAKDILASFKHIATNREDASADGANDYSAKRWWSYAEPPINNLLQLDIPIFVQAAGKDESAPIESTYLIPLEFTRLDKKNLQYEICEKCDHGFKIEKNNGEIEDKWSGIFQAFIRWTEKSKQK